MKVYSDAMLLLTQLINKLTDARNTIEIKLDELHARDKLSVKNYQLIRDLKETNELIDRLKENNKDIENRLEARINREKHLAAFSIFRFACTLV